MSYNIRKIRHVCSVKGCGNRDVVLIAKNGHIGGVYLCSGCAKAAFDAFEKVGVGAVKEAETVAGAVTENAAEVKKGARKKAAVPKDGE